MSDSPAYRAFVDGYLEPDLHARARDGCPLELLDALDPTERRLAERELLRRISLTDDWPLQGLGHLRSVAALPELRQLLVEAQDPHLKEPYGSMVAYVALAIWQIERDEAMCDVVLRASVDRYCEDPSSPRTFLMIDIIHCLAQFPQDRARKRLRQLEASPNHLIAYNADYAQRLHPGDRRR